jgi:hypothetical protein
MSQMTIEEKIRTALKEVYGSTKAFTTTVSAIVDIVTSKYIEKDHTKSKKLLAK